MKKLIAFTLMFMAVQLSAQLKPVAYTEGAQKLNGFAAAPAKPLKQKPGILILPAWMGINDHSKEVAQKLSALGYYTFIADIYGEGKYPASPKEAGEQAGYYKKNVDRYQQRIAAAMTALIKSGADANNIVVIGYCFGGTGALEAARGDLNIKGAVSFHGGIGKDAARANSTINPKVLVLHGADDPHVSQKEIDGFITEMKEAKADWQLIYLPNAVHAFTEKSAGNDNSKGAAYNQKADERSWQYFLDFLKETFNLK